MARSESNELRRSGLNPALEREPAAGGGHRGGSTDDAPPDSVPEDNRPGHHPEVEQDQPDPLDFVARSHDRAVRAAHEHEHEHDEHEVISIEGAVDARDHAGRVAAAAVRIGRSTGSVVAHVTATGLRRVADVLDPPGEEPALSGTDDRS